MMSAFVTVVMSLVGLVKKNSQIVAVCLLILLWILMGFNTKNADYTFYELYYELRVIDVFGLNIGYVFTEQIAWLFGLDFMQYRCLFGAVALALLYAFVRRYTDYTAAVLSLYLLMPFFYDVVQFKFFLAAAVAIYAMHFLIDGKRYWVAKAAIGIAVASSIHPAALLFCFFGVGKMQRDTAAIVSIVAMVILLFLVYSGIAQGLFIQQVDSVKAALYFSKLGRFGFIPYLISVVFIVAMVYLMSNEIEKNETASGIMRDAGESQTATIRQKNEYLVFFESAVFALLPLSAFMILSLQDFYRPIRSALILFYIFFVIVQTEKKSALSRQTRVIIQISFFLWFAFTFFFVIVNVWDLVVITELNNNLVFR